MPLALLVALALAGTAALLPVLARRRHPGEGRGRFVADPVRDARAEFRARDLLRETAGEEAFAMYAQLGFLALDTGDPGYGYLIYPHRPIVSFDAGSGELLSEYCVRFPDDANPSAGEWLPDADDVLAKWIALRADERRLIAAANMHLPGRQHDPDMLRRDLAELRRWRDRRWQEEVEPHV